MAPAKSCRVLGGCCAGMSGPQGLVVPCRWLGGLQGPSPVSSPSPWPGPGRGGVETVERGERQERGSVLAPNLLWLHTPVALSLV